MKKQGKNKKEGQNNSSLTKSNFKSTTWWSYHKTLTLEFMPWAHQTTRLTTQLVIPDEMAWETEKTPEQIPTTKSFHLASCTSYHLSPWNNSLGATVLVWADDQPLIISSKGVLTQGFHRAMSWKHTDIQKNN